MDDYATIVLPETLARFARSHPDVELEVTTGFTRDLLNSLGEEFDLATAFAGAGPDTRRPVDLLGLLEIAHRNGMTEGEDISVVEAVRPDGTSRRFAFGSVTAHSVKEGTP